MMSERRLFEVSPERAGAYHSISKALEAIDESCPNDGRPVTIHIEPGEYRERVEIHRPYVTLVGETADSVRIVGSLGAKMPSGDGSGIDGKLGTFRTYTVLVDADDVRLENLTIVNDAGDGREVGQAIALYADGDRLVVDACCITGRQDTLFLGPLPPREVKPGGFIGPKQFAPRRVGRQYFRRCRIEGDVDFIFGGACAYFEGCEIRSLNRNMDVNGYVTAASTPEDFEAWQIATRVRLFDLLGLSIMDRVSIEARELDRVKIAGGIVRTHAMLQVERDVWMPFYLLEPQSPKLDARGRKCCYICLHGHQGAGAASVAGVTGVPAVDDAVRKFNYDYGLRLARMGYVTVCPDARGWGYRRDWKGQGDDENSFLRGTCLNQARMTEPLGLTVAGLNAWDNMRLIDYLEARGDIAMDDLGCFGFSGGGYMTLYLAALDPRVCKAFVSGYLYGVDDSLLHLNGNCSCNYTPGLWRLLDMGDIASLIAPRPLLVQSCEEDHLNGSRGLKNVDEQLKIVRDAYKLLGRRDALRHEVCPGGHHLGVTHLVEDIEWLDSHVAKCDRA